MTWKIERKNLNFRTHIKSIGMDAKLHLEQYDFGIFRINIWWNG
jgi:hypothetical protein